jgi:transposase
MFHARYDLDARYAIKRETQGPGYKVHLTETCDAHGPHLITQVATTPATSMDYDTTATVQAGLTQPHESGSSAPPVLRTIQAVYSIV